MAQFSRTTLFEACNLLARRLQYHGAFEDLMYRWELDNFAENPAGAIHQRCRVTVHVDTYLGSSEATG